MIRRLLVPLLGTGLLLAATAGSALAKCEGPNPPDFCSQVVAWLSTGGGSSGVHLTAGTATPVDINVSRGEMPFVADSVVLVFTRIGEDTAVRVPATRGAAGWWHAKVNLPDDGAWSIVAELGVNGEIQRQDLELLNVAAAPKAPEPPVTTTPSTPVSPMPPVLPIALLVAGIAAAAIVGTSLRQRSRRRAPAD